MSLCCPEVHFGAELKSNLSFRFLSSDEKKKRLCQRATDEQEFRQYLGPVIRDQRRLKGISVRS